MQETLSSRLDDLPHGAASLSDDADLNMVQLRP
jgi:hypothetical protein